MRLLVLGGTKFLGRAIVEAALARGQEVTLFNRGQTNPELFPEVEKLHGDRDGDLTALECRDWDAVVDVNGYVPRVVRASARQLAGAVERYTFVSSIAVYADLTGGPREGDALEQLTEAGSEDVPKHYGALKALCEQEVEKGFADRALLVRPGLIVGPHDPTGRFTYWPHRIARGGDVLAPGRPERQVQFIDVRDLAEWVVRAVERGDSGTFNATGPEPPVTMGDLLDECARVSGADARLVWIPEDFLLARGVGTWMELPLWVREKKNGLLETDISRAVNAGLTFRPLADTIRETLEHAETTDDAGLVREREAELLEAWATRP